jgi:hypothetical protein
MELLLILTYSAICVAIFKIFKIPIKGRYPRQSWEASF